MIIRNCLINNKKMYFCARLYIQIHMKKIIFLLLMVMGITTQLSAENQDNEPRKQIVLSGFYLKDSKVGHLATDISNYIYRRKNGYNWPITKMIFSQDENKALKINIIAIDNEWNNLIGKGEVAYGYFIMNNRMFIVITKEDAPMDLAPYFESKADSDRNFFLSESKTVIKNPTWEYLIDSECTFPKQLKSENLAILGK